MFKKYLRLPLAICCLFAFASTSLVAGEPLADNPSDLVYQLATLGCADDTKGEIETRLTEIGPEAELALWDALELGPTAAQLEDRRNFLAKTYQERFSNITNRELYSTERLARMHASSEEEYVDYRMERFMNKYQLRAQSALENLDYARDNDQGFWKREVYVDKVANGVALSAFPNPFRDQTTVQFTTNSNQRVKAAVYDISGREVAQLYNGPATEQQTYTFQFGGAELSNGTYIFRVVSEEGTHSTRLMLAR